MQKGFASSGRNLCDRLIKAPDARSIAFAEQ
jgi:hypothetical protein